MWFLINNYLDNTLFICVIHDFTYHYDRIRSNGIAFSQVQLRFHIQEGIAALFYVVFIDLPSIISRLTSTLVRVQKLSVINNRIAIDDVTHVTCQLFFPYITRNITKCKFKSILKNQSKKKAAAIFDFVTMYIQYFLHNIFL